MEKFTDYDELSKSMEYLAYITSPEWKKKCDQRMKIDGHTCQMCGCRGTISNPLQCHHFHYGNFKHENVYKDLITLCKSCHESQHNMLRRITDENGGRMWDSSDHVPIQHIYTISGLDRNLLEERR